MSAALTITAIGVGASVYSGVRAGQRQDAASSAAASALAANQGVAEELKKRQRSLVDIPLEQKIAELQGKKITASGQQALDRFNLDMAAADRAVQEQADLVGEGATGSRELTNRFRRAQGVAGINIQDQSRKESELGGFMQMAQQTPGWAQVATGSNTQQAAFQQGLAQTAGEQEGSAYATAARGLGGLADLYARGYRFGVNPDITQEPAPTATTNPNLDPGLTTLPQRQLIDWSNVPSLPRQ